MPESVQQPFAAIARECLRTDPQRRCAIGEIKARLEAPSSLPEPTAKSAPTVLAKQGLTAIVAAALALLIIVSALLLRSHQPRPSRPVEERQAVASSAAPTHPSHATKKPSSKAAPVNETAAANQVLPDVPLRARNTIQGTIHVSIRVTVDSSGAVSDATVDSAGSKYFSNLALQAARQWRFKPSPAKEQAHSRVWLLRFEFTQTSTKAVPVEVTR